MTAVYVASSESYSGKTLSCIVLGTRWQEQGRKIGYLRPLGVVPVRIGDQLADEDSLFVAGQLGIKATASELCPIVLGPEQCEADPEAARQQVLNAFASAAAGKDVILVNGTGPMSIRGSMLGLDGISVSELLDAKVVLVGRCNSFLDVDGFVAAHRELGSRLAAVILNRVGAHQREEIEQHVVPCLRKRGITVLGLLPEDPVLHSVTVSEVAEALNGEVLCAAEAADAMVENFVVGAMNVEGALRYFRRTPRKCVITGGDRSDIQLAALETPTRCLVLTGGMPPSHTVLARAEEKGVPVLLVTRDTLSTVTAIDDVLGKLRVRGSKKIEHARQQFESHLDLTRLDQVLGLT
jgi:hypothetical protein